MKFLPTLLLLLSMAITSTWGQDSQQVNTQSILQDLEQIEKQQKQNQTSARQATINQLRNASMSGSAASALYAQAVEDTQFEGRANKAAAFNDWKTENGDLLRSHQLETCLTLQLRYLVLTLERAAAKDGAPFVAPSLAYVKDLIAADIDLAGDAQKAEQVKNDAHPNPRDKQNQGGLQKLGGLKKDLLDKSLTDSIFVKWMRIGAWLPDKSIQWELSPGNISGILDRNVRSVMREQKNPAIVGTWDLEMQATADRATLGRLDFVATDFNAGQRPVMQFNRANDMIVVGMKNRGITEIYALVKTYPQHPDFSKWIARLRELLKSTATVAPAGATPQETSPQ